MELKKISIMLVTTLIIIFTFWGCSTAEKSVDKKTTDSVYVFDDTSDINISGSDENAKPARKNFLYYVQVGAFTSYQRAEKFAEENRKSIKYTMNITFSEEVNYYVIQLPPFNTKEEAEVVRNELWKKKNFSDAFILTVVK